MTTSTPAGSYGRASLSTAFLQAYVDAQVAGVLDTAPETLDTLNELAAAINDDPAFFSSMATANAALQTNIDTLTTNASDARTALQTLLQNAVDAVQADVDTNEADADTAIAAEATARGTAITNLQTTLQGLLDAETARVDALIASGMWLYADQSAFPAAADNHGRVVHSHADGAQFYAHGGAWVKLATDAQITAVQTDVDANELASDVAETALSNRLDVLEADPTTKTYVDTQVAGLVDSAPGVLNTLDELAAALGDDENFATTITNSIAAVQTDVDANETASDAAEAALSTRLDTLEADPTTATAVAAVQTDVDANEAARKTYFAWESNLSKVINPVRGSRIDVGNNITFYPASGYNTEIKGNLTTDNTTKVFFTLTDAADDAAAATAGVDVGQLYRNGSVVMIRVS